MTRRPAVLLVGAVLLLAGCGAASPQLPVKHAERVSSALTGIAEACGEAYQQSVPDSKHAAAATIEATATMRARELAQVFTGDPEGIYQAQTLRQIIAQAIAYLNECGMHSAAAELERRTR